MTTTLNASTAGAGGFIATSDNSGILALQTAGTTAITVDASQRAAFVAGTAALPAITTTGNTNTGIFFPATNTIAFTEAGTEKMRLTDNGFLCINKTSTQYSETLSIATANQQGIHINETSNSSNINIQYFTKGTGFTMTGAIYYNGSVMAYLTTSDYRLKENVAPISNALNKISLLKPVTYTWKDNQQSGEGFLAHELQEHFPDAVSGTKDEVDEKGNPKYQGMDASVLIASMVKAIQELKVQNDALTARIVALETK
jgi:hypothetical protein